MSGDADSEAAESAEPTETEVPGAEVPEFEEGRYVYCIVDVTDEGAVAGNEDGPEFETAGIEDEPVSLIVLEGSSLAAVVHSCDRLYDSADLTEVKRWLVRHQTVVDRAAEAFGTPLPFQFDTIIRGDDETVRSWLREERDELESALDSLADHWEYRVEVVETDPVDEETLVEQDDELASLRAQIEAASEGRGFLLEKQFEQRVRECRRNRRESLSDDLRGRLEGCTRAIRELERSPAASLGDTSSEPDHGERLCRLTLLAHIDDEEAIGSALDDVAAKPGLEVRFTGPWPPYSFSPVLGGGDAEP